MPLYADPIPVITVELGWTVWALMGSAAVVRVDTILMALNDIVHRTLTSAKIPARLEPSGLQRSDGKQLVWDVTCPDTFASSYTISACYLGGRACSCRSRRGERPNTCTSVGSLHCFTPL